MIIAISRCHCRTCSGNPVTHARKFLTWIPGIKPGMTKNGAMKQEKKPERHNLFRFAVFNEGVLALHQIKNRRGRCCDARACSIHPVPA